MIPLWIGLFYRLRRDRVEDISQSRFRHALQALVIVKRQHSKGAAGLKMNCSYQDKARRSGEFGLTKDLVGYGSPGVFILSLLCV